MREMEMIVLAHIQSHRRTRLDGFRRVRDALTLAPRQSFPSLASLCYSFEQLRSAHQACAPYEISLYTNSEGLTALGEPL